MSNGEVMEPAIRLLTDVLESSDGELLSDVISWISECGTCLNRTLCKRADFIAVVLDRVRSASDAASSAAAANRDALGGAGRRAKTALDLTAFPPLPESTQTKRRIRTTLIAGTDAISSAGQLPEADEVVSEKTIRSGKLTPVRGSCKAPKRQNAEFGSSNLESPRTPEQHGRPSSSSVREPLASDSSSSVVPNRPGSSRCPDGVSPMAPNTMLRSDWMDITSMAQSERVKIERLSSLYAAMLRWRCPPYGITEQLEVLLRLLTVRGTIEGSEACFSVPSPTPPGFLLRGPRHCVYFAARALCALEGSGLVWGLGVRAWALLARHDGIRRYAQNLAARMAQLVSDAARLMPLPLRLNSASSATGTGTSAGLTAALSMGFNEASESRLHFETPALLTLYKNRQVTFDAFRDALRDFRRLVDGGAVTSSTLASSRFSGRMMRSGRGGRGGRSGSRSGGRSVAFSTNVTSEPLAAIWTSCVECFEGVHEANHCWFAQLFVAQLLEVCVTKNTTLTGEQDDHVKKLVASDGKLSKLHRRFSSSGNAVDKVVSARKDLRRRSKHRQHFGRAHSQTSRAKHKGSQPTDFHTSVESSSEPHFAGHGALRDVGNGDSNTTFEENWGEEFKADESFFWIFLESNDSHTLNSLLEPWLLAKADQLSDIGTDLARRDVYDHVDPHSPRFDTRGSSRVHDVRTTTTPPPLLSGDSDAAVTARSAMISSAPATRVVEDAGLGTVVTLDIATSHFLELCAALRILGKFLGYLRFRPYRGTSHEAFSSRVACVAFRKCLAESTLAAELASARVRESEIDNGISGGYRTNSLESVANPEGSLEDGTTPLWRMKQDGGREGQLTDRILNAAECVLVIVRLTLFVRAFDRRGTLLCVIPWVVAILKALRFDRVGRSSRQYRGVIQLLRRLHRSSSTWGEYSTHPGRSAVVMDPAMSPLSSSTGVKTPSDGSSKRNGRDGDSAVARATNALFIIAEIETLFHTLGLPLLSPLRSEPTEMEELQRTESIFGRPWFVATCFSGADSSLRGRETAGGRAWCLDQCAISALLDSQRHTVAVEYGVSVKLDSCVTPAVMSQSDNDRRSAVSEPQRVVVKPIPSSYVSVGDMYEIRRSGSFSSNFDCDDDDGSTIDGASLRHAAPGMDRKELRPTFAPSPETARQYNQRSQTSRRIRPVTLSAAPSSDNGIAAALQPGFLGDNVGIEAGSSAVAFSRHSIGAGERVALTRDKLRDEWDRDEETSRKLRMAFLQRIRLSHPRLRQIVEFAAEIAGDTAAESALSICTPAAVGEALKALPEAKVPASIPGSFPKRPGSMLAGSSSMSAAELAMLKRAEHKARSAATASATNLVQTHVAAIINACVSGSEAAAAGRGGDRRDMIEIAKRVATDLAASRARAFLRRGSEVAAVVKQEYKRQVKLAHRVRTGVTSSNEIVAEDSEVTDYPLEKSSTVNRDNGSYWPNGWSHHEVVL